MSLLLTLEQGPRAQAVRQTRLDKGELVIGRSPEADWQIDDPDKFVSRAHCTISADENAYFVTDTSSSGLFIDSSSSPLGPGNTVPLRNGMRLRLGDYVIWVELQEKSPGQQMSSHTTEPSPVRGTLGIRGDDFFSMTTEEEPQASRPADLPNPFDHPEPGAYRESERANPDRPISPAFDDPFSLDPLPTPASRESDAAPWTSAPNGREPSPHQSPLDFGPDRDHLPERAVTYGGRTDTENRAPSPAPWDVPVHPTQERPPTRQAPAKPIAAQAPPPIPSHELRAAFLRGLGLSDEEIAAGDAVAEMERLGRQYRVMMEGLMQLLRKRAEEKGNARVAQTVVGASEVNPLKFLPTVEDALVTILAERSPGFLSGEAAVSDAVRDLAQHHIRTWRGLQSALRRMIDRFDPAVIEKELESSSALHKLLAGGRAAKLWELYCKRHREIARSAEERFLGEIGADFRDAYEEE